MTLFRPTHPLRAGVKLIFLFVILLVTTNGIKAQNQSNVDSWRGHVYNNSNFTSYEGAYNENETFSQGFGGSDDWNWYRFRNLWLIRSTFSVRYRMQSTKTGCYVATLSADDGIRLYVDGTEVFDEWIDQGTTSYSNILMNLSGSSQLVYEYYENGGGNTVRFQTFTKLNSITGNQNQTICSGDRPANITGSANLAQSRRGGARYENGRNTTYRWEFSIDGGAWQNISGATNRNYRPPVLTNSGTVDKVYRYRRVATYTQRLPKVNQKVYVDNTAVATVVVQADIGNAGNISGPSEVELGDGGIVFTVPPIAGATNYNWTFPAGVTIVSGANTNSVTVNITNSASSGNVRVRGSNSCGNSGESVHALTVRGPNLNPIKINNQAPDIGTTPVDLVQNVLVTGCLTASGITFKGDQSKGIGYFDKGDSDFPLTSGVILSSGDVVNARGPASRNARDQIGGFDFDANNQDSDLRVLAETTPRYRRGRIIGWDRPYYDAQVLEFDFVPAGDKIEFNYIFASEEYNGYACSNYNDGFAFILSGPGITNDTGLSGKNIALTESGDQVTINNVYKNQCPSCPDNSDLYVEEIGGYPIAFDGRTKVLTARANVTACQTYHIKLIVYDRNDQSYNSAVFLEAKSFKSNEVTVENRLDGIDGDKEIMYRGCDKSYISFSRKERLEEEYTFHVTITGSATNGVDYYQVTEAGVKVGDFPENITFAPGQSEIKIYYMASDAVSGAKDILFEVLRGCPCSTDDADYFRKKIDILDVGEIKANAISNVTCGGGTPISTIIVELKDGLDPNNYLYALDGGSFQTENKFQGTFTVGSHTVTIKDKFSCSSKDVPINIPEPTDLEANAGADFEMCEKETSRTLNGTGGIDYVWTCDKAIGLTDMDVNSENPSISPTVPAGVYTYTLTVSDGIGKACESSDDVVVTIKPTPVINSLVADKVEVCSGTEINLTATVGNGINPVYKWSPSGEITGSGLNVKAVPVTNILASRTYTLEVVSDNSCKTSQDISGIKVYPNPSLSLSASDSNLCSDGSNGKVKVIASGGTPRLTAPEYNYSWNHNGSLDNDTANGLAPNTYTITVTDSKSCSGKLDVEVKPVPKPIGIFFQ